MVLCSDSEKCFSLFADYFNLEHVASVFKMNPDIKAYIIYLGCDDTYRLDFTPQLSEMAKSLVVLLNCRPRELTKPY